MYVGVFVEVVAVLADVVQLGVDGRVVLPPTGPGTPLPAEGAEREAVGWRMLPEDQL